jgi:hypothetical protein
MRGGARCFTAWLFIGLIGACGSKQNNTNPSPGSDGGSPDLAQAPAGGGNDLAVQPVVTSMCTTPISDGQACSTGCGTGMLCAGYTAATVGCYKQCDPNAPACPCGRRCTVIMKPDNTTAGACLPANGPGERCGTDPGGMPYGTGNCQQGLACVGGGAGSRYCVGPCMTSEDCPAQTTCEATVAGMMVAGTVCWYNSQPTGKPIGTACTLTDICITDSLCDGTCKPRCTGPGDTSCTSGTCQALSDANQKLIGYICK